MARLSLKESEPRPHYRLVGSIRLVMFLLAMAGSAVLGGGFAGFNFAIVCMVNETTLQGNWTRDQRDEGYDGEFHWDRSVQAHLMAAHAYGALVANIPSGLVSDRYGSRLVLAACLACNALANLCTPVAAAAGFGWVFAARVVQGLGYGASWPALISMIPSWSTSWETGLMFSLVAMGYHIGTLLAMVTSSALCYSWLRWPAIFYLWGVVSALFALAWLAVYSDQPARCRFIGPDELGYLQNSRMRSTGDSGDRRRSFWRVPWLRLAFSTGALATHCGQFACTWATYYISEYMPTYSKDVLMVDVRSNGVTSSLPPLCLVLARNVIGPLGDRLSFGRGRSRTFGVKLFNALGTVVPALCFLGLGFLDRRHRTLAVAAFCLASGSLASSTVGYGRGGVLMAPAYSGALASLSNTWGDVGALVMPYLVGWMAGRGTVPEWQHTAWLTAAVMAVSFLVYQVFGTAEEQPWAKQEQAKAKAAANKNVVFAITQEPRSIMAPPTTTSQQQQACCHRGEAVLSVAEAIP